MEQEEEHLNLQLWVISSASPLTGVMHLDTSCKESGMIRIL